MSDYTHCMRLKNAALLEPTPAKHKQLSQQLAKAGLTISKAHTVAQLKKEQLVILGPSLKHSARVAQEIRLACPDAMILAAQSKAFKAAYADAILPLPISVNDLKVRLKEFEFKFEPAPTPDSGILDGTTGFYTFTHFKEVLFIEVKRARRYGFPLALALIGFDPVKGVAAKHEAQLMAGLALSIRRSLRDTDYPVQYSKERVVLLMPHTDLAGSLIVARRIVERVGKASLQVGNAFVQPTISVGVAAGEPGTEYAFSDLVRQAQAGLDSALLAGGNKVEFVNSVGSEISSGSGFFAPPIPPVL
jgi:diguanylate cyclase (GGDEF)-like protein